MALLNEQILQDVQKMLADLPHDVRLVVFTTDNNCEYCPQIVQLVQEIAQTTDKLQVEVHDFQASPEEAQRFNITMAPAIAIVGEKDYGLRYYGIPSGYEFSTLLHAITRASNGHSDLDEYTKTFLTNLQQPVNLQVFVTPTCPYCPRSAVLAYDMAVESPWVTADVVESMEFEELAMKFNVMGVPLNIVNGKERVEGAAPPPMMLDAIRAALAS